MWKIGNVEIKNRVVLAPMAGICNSAYRTIIKEMGCGLIEAEMVSDKAISFGNEKTIDMLYMTDFERPISQQIFGSDVESFVTSAKYIYEHMKPDIIDINMGCPVPKVAVRAQAGSALLKDPDKIYEIVLNVVKAVPIPVTVKIRSGWDFNNINAVEVAKIIEKAGASAITVHPRTRSQGYSGIADWNIIKQVKEMVSIPVIGNGDIHTCYDAKRMIDETGCDAVMIGRGVLGNPWLIKECVDYLEKGIEPKQITHEEKILMIRKHLNYLLKIKPEKVAILEMRSHASWYLKGIPNGAKIRSKINQITTTEEFEQLLNDFEGGKYEDK
ncbi:MAG: tRNA dihydrouridine synthase DusB [Firmicutes bacterium]|nr:tRNA dihydrouridine synthase DusB [Bacillota bacterium]